MKKFALPILTLLLTLAACVVWAWPWIWWRFDWPRLLGLQPYILGVPLTLLALGAWVLLLSAAAKRRYLAVRMLTVLVSVLLSWTAVEACYITYDTMRREARKRFPGRSEMIFDKDLYFVRRPNDVFQTVPFNGKLPGYKRITLKTNRNGFRVDDHLTEAGVVVVGDSFTEGAETPEDEIFCTLLGRCLGEPVANLGRSGYGPQQELIVLKRYGLPYKPHAAIWMLWEGNDLDDTRKFEQFLKNPVEAPKGFLADTWKSSLIRKLWYAHQQGGLMPLIGTFHAADGKDHPLEFLVPYSQNVRDQEKHWLVMRDTLRRGFELCRERGIRLVVGVLPTKYRVMGALCDFEDPARKAEFEDRTSLHPGVLDMAAAVRNLCQENNVEFVDFTPDLAEKARAGKVPYYGMIDVHISPVGHRTVAERLCAVLKTPPPDATPDETSEQDEPDRGPAPEP